MFKALFFAASCFKLFASDSEISPFSKRLLMASTSSFKKSRSSVFIFSLSSFKISIF